MLCVTGICAGNSPETGEFPAQIASNAEKVSIRWRHHGIDLLNHWQMPDIAIQEYAFDIIIGTFWVDICATYGTLSHSSHRFIVI